MDYLDKLDRHFREMTGKTALRDMGREISYGELGIISGRIYSYLRAMNIGREDIVLINLPSSAAVFPRGCLHLLVTFFGLVSPLVVIPVCSLFYLR